MYTQSLQSAHKPAYEAFFQTNELVFSIPYSFCLSNVALRYNKDFFHARTSIDKRLYIGITFTTTSTDRKIQLGTVTERDCQLNEFITTDFTKSSLASIQDQLNVFLADEEIACGAKISFFSEVSRGMCFAFSGHVSLGIAMALELINSSTSYTKMLSVMLDSPDDMIPLIEKGCKIWSLFTKNPPKALFYQSLKPLLCPRVFSYGSLDKVYPDTTSDVFGKYGVQYAVIFSGLLSHTVIAEQEISAGMNKFEKFREVNSMLSNDYIEYLHQLVTNPYNTGTTAGFFTSLGKYNALVHAQLGITSFEVDFLEKYLAFNSHSQNQVELLPLYHSRYGGSYIVYFSGPTAEESISKTLEQMKTNFSRMQVEFQSNRSMKPLFPSIDQSVAEGIVSQYSVKGNYVVRECLSGERNIIRYDEATFQSEDLLLDQIARRIYVRGVRVSSKDIPTQQATIELLTAFFSGKSEINIAELSKSSYTSNKSDMTSKLITPIKKLTKKVFGEELDIVCRGGISDFFVVLRHPESFKMVRVVRGGNY